MDAAERSARRAYVSQVIDDLLSIPLKVIRGNQVACAVLCNRVAFLSDAGELSVASYRHGVLFDYDFSIGDGLEGIPIRRCAKEIKQVMFDLAVPQVAAAMAEWRGEPVDLRMNCHSNWALETPSGDGEPEFAADLRTRLDEVPALVWRKWLNEIADAVGIDNTVGSASSWMLLGELDSAVAYSKLRDVSGLAEAQRSRTGRSLFANALSMAFARRADTTDVHGAVKWFKTFASVQGVNRIGWNLLLHSPLSYWRRLMRDGHDDGAVWLALLAGQASLPPRLPSTQTVRLLRQIAFEMEMEDGFDQVPPPIWRSILEKMSRRGRDASMEVSEVLAWAWRVGKAIPKNIRRASWSTLERHAFEDALNQIEQVNAARSLSMHATVKLDGVVARRIVSADALGRVAIVMRNCLSTFASEVEAGSVVIYYAVEQGRRAAIMLIRAFPGDVWVVKDVKGPADRPAGKCFWNLSIEICALWNGGSTQREQAQGRKSAVSGIVSSRPKVAERTMHF